MKKMISKFATAVASLALLVAVAEANSACALFLHQPELPESVKALRKF